MGNAKDEANHKMLQQKVEMTQQMESIKDDLSHRIAQRDQELSDTRQVLVGMEADRSSLRTLAKMSIRLVGSRIKKSGSRIKTKAKEIVATAGRGDSNQ